MKMPIITNQKLKSLYNLHSHLLFVLQQKGQNFKLIFSDHLKQFFWSNKFNSFQSIKHFFSWISFWLRQKKKLDWKYIFFLFSLENNFSNTVFRFCKTKATILLIKDDIERVHEGVAKNNTQTRDSTDTKTIRVLLEENVTRSRNVQSKVFVGPHFRKNKRNIREISDLVVHFRCADAWVGWVEELSWSSYPWQIWVVFLEHVL